MLVWPYLYMKNEILPLYKRPGETPLERLDRLRTEKPEYSGDKLSYLGRLDPLAEGVLLVAVGEGNKRREEYLALPKEYIVDILFGFSTDTFDVMGLIENISEHLPTENEIRDAVAELTHPAFSSKTVEGKSLFAWAREGLLHTIKRPTREVKIMSAELVDMKKISASGLQTLIHADITRVQGDFRQKDILSRWDGVLAPYSDNRAWIVAKAKIMCGSGVYMRGLANDIGKSVKTEALALHINRIKVGEYTVSEDIG